LAAMLEISYSKNMKNVQFLNADTTRLSFPDEHFLVIISIAILEFVDDLQMVTTKISSGSRATRVFVDYPDWSIE
jgi:ubiquinone/menaquinone biosynthesis C-methylase UbiE